MTVVSIAHSFELVLDSLRIRFFSLFAHRRILAIISWDIPNSSSRDAISRTLFTSASVFIFKPPLIIPEAITQSIYGQSALAS